MAIDTFITVDQIQPAIYNGIVGLWQAVYNLNQAGMVTYMPDKVEVIMDFAIQPQSIPVQVLDNTVGTGTEGGTMTVGETGTDTTVNTGTTTQNTNRTTNLTRNTLTTNANTSQGTDTQNTSDNSTSTTYNNSSQSRNTDVQYTWTFETAG